jgi:hypothetical protein
LTAGMSRLQRGQQMLLSFFKPVEFGKATTV